MENAARFFVVETPKQESTFELMILGRYSSFTSLFSNLIFNGHTSTLLFGKIPPPIGRFGY